MTDGSTITGALSGNPAEVKRLVAELISHDAERQQAVFAALQGRDERELWQNLLTLLAEGRWGTLPDRFIYPGGEQHDRLVPAVHALFAQDVSPEASVVKEDVLLSGLKSQSATIRRTSAELLGVRHSRRAADPLIEALKDPDDRVRARAAQALGNIGAESSVEHLVECLFNPSPTLKHYAQQALSAIGRPAAPHLRRLATESDGQVRWLAIKSLSEIGDPEAAPDLVQALKDEDVGIRWLAAEGLIKTGRDGLPYLLRRLIEEGRSPRVRSGAHHVLTAMREETGLRDITLPVIEALEGAEPSAQTPVAAYAALERLRAAR
jgi:hypothetical protein